MAALIIGAALSPTHVSACSCSDPDEPRLELQHADAVFSGTVVAENAALPHVELRDQWPFLAIVAGASITDHVTFSVDRVWKGPTFDTLVVQLDANSVVCGETFTSGERYLVYAYGQPPSLMIGMCSGTTPVAGAQADFAVLGPGSPPSVRGTNRPNDELSVVGVIVCSASIVAVLATMLYRRRRRLAL